ncbi:MAG: hypothetical protein KC609_23975, partial [Myxococcales bacterium]|nr:hypothetical protein [Myxococcales bacterium]
VTSLALGFACPYWKLAGVPEVFALHALLVAGVLYLAVGSRPRGCWRAIAAGLVFGLGLSHQLTIVFAAPLVVVALWRALTETRQPTSRDPIAATVPAARGEAAAEPGESEALRAIGMIGLFVVALAAGLSAYLYLILTPTEGWSWTTIGGLDDLLDHVLRRQYGTLKLAGTSRLPAWSVVAWAIGKQASALGGVGALAGLWGFARIGRPPRSETTPSLSGSSESRAPLGGSIGASSSVRSGRALGIALISSWFLAGVLLFALAGLRLTPISRSVLERFTLMPLVLLAPGIAVALEELASRLSAARWRRITFAMIAGALLVFASLRLPEAAWTARTGIERFVGDTLDDAPPNAVIFGQGDHLLTSMELAIRSGPARWRSLLYVDVHMLRRRPYYDWVKRRWPNLPIPFSAARTRLAFLLVNETRVRRKYCFLDALRILRGLPSYPRGTLICLGRMPREQVIAFNLRRLAERGIPARPEAEIEPWFAELFPRYLRPLRAIRPLLVERGRRRELAIIDQFLRRH